MANTTAKKVIFATDEATVHLLLSPTPDKDAAGREIFAVESRVLKPGDYIEQEQVPPYLIEKINKGEAPGLSLVTKAKAKATSEKAAEMRAINEAIKTSGQVSEADQLKQSVQLAEQATAEESENE